MSSYLRAVASWRHRQSWNPKERRQARRLRYPICVLILSCNGLWFGLAAQQTWTLQFDTETKNAQGLYRVSSVQVETSRMFVLNSSSGEVLIFNDDGDFVESFGGLGEGPGEFRLASKLWVFRDTAVVWDTGAMRLSVFDMTISPPRLVDDFSSKKRIGVHGVFSGSRVLVSSLQNQYGVTSSHPQPRTREYSLVDLRNGDETRHVGSHPGPLGVLVTIGGRQAVREPIFARRVEEFVKDDFFWIGLNDDPEVLRFNTRGDLVQRISWDQSPRKVAEKDKEEFWSRLDEVERTRVYPGVPYSEYFPFYSRILVDDEFNLWVNEYRPRYEFRGRPGFWRVFDLTGQHIANVQTPAGLLVSDIEKDRLVGVHRDSYDVEHIQVYDIVK